MPIKILFFGSFQHYSALILESLIKSKAIEITGVVSTPDNLFIKNLCEQYNIKLFTPKKLNNIFLKKLPNCDLILTAGYGKLLPKNYLDWPKIKALNLHFSLLPKYRGANPGEWAILRGDKESGISLIEMNQNFDTGKILYQKKIKILNTDTRVSLYNKLYKLGAKILPDILNKYCKGVLPYAPTTQGSSPTPYASRFTRPDAFIDWRAFEKAMAGEKIKIDWLSPKLRRGVACNARTGVLKYAHIARAIRALHGYPTVWTYIKTKKGQKRLKIFSSKILDKKLVLETVQVEGQNQAKFNQIKNMIGTA